MTISTLTDNTKTYADSDVYTDANALSNLKRQARENQDQALPEVAKKFESIFIGMMLKSMRQASFGDPLVSSSAIDTFQDMHDQQMSIELSKGKGFGIAESIVKQLRQDKNNTINPVPIPADQLNLPQRKNFYLDYSDTKKQILAIHNNANGNDLPDIDKSGTNNQQIRKEDNEPIVFKSAEDFVEKLWPMAENAAKKLGVDAEVLLSQAALETGWGQSIINNAHSSSNNLFNIKADSRWGGEKMAKLSLEYEDNKAVNKTSYFRVYDNLQDSFDDYVNFIKTNPRYEKALQQINDPEQYLHGIHKAGYATDPNYVDKIMKVMNSSNIQSKVTGKG